MIMKLLSDAHFVHAGQGERRMSPVTIQILQLQVLTNYYYHFIAKWNLLAGITELSWSSLSKWQCSWVISKWQRSRILWDNCYTCGSFLNGLDGDENNYPLNSNTYPYYWLKSVEYVVPVVASVLSSFLYVNVTGIIFFLFIHLKFYDIFPSNNVEARSRSRWREKGFIPLQLLQQRHYREDPY